MKKLDKFYLDKGWLIRETNEARDVFVKRGDVERAKKAQHLVDTFDAWTPLTYPDRETRYRLREQMYELRELAGLED